MTAEIKNPKSGIFASQVHDIINRVKPLREGVTVNVSYISRHGDVQVEIRRHGLLEWYGCVFEPEFLSAFEATLLCLQQN